MKELRFKGKAKDEEQRTRDNGTMGQGPATRDIEAKGTTAKTRRRRGNKSRDKNQGAEDEGKATCLDDLKGTKSLVGHLMGYELPQDQAKAIRVRPSRVATILQQDLWRTPIQ